MFPTSATTVMNEECEQFPGFNDHGACVGCVTVTVRMRPVCAGITVWARFWFPFGAGYEVMYEIVEASICVKYADVTRIWSKLAFEERNHSGSQEGDLQHLYSGCLSLKNTECHYWVPVA